MAYIKELRQLIGTRPFIMVGSAVLVTNERHEILLQLRTDTNDWGIPGGAMEPGETIEETAIRELREETGLTGSSLRFLGVLSGKSFYHRYPHGDEVYNVINVFQTDRVQGVLHPYEEGAELAYFPLDRLPKLNATAEKMLRSFFVTLME